MKKVITVMAALVVILAVAGCKKKSQNEQNFDKTMKTMQKQNRKAQKALQKNLDKAGKKLNEATK